MAEFEILRDDTGRAVYRIQTPSGVIAYIDVTIPDAALDKLAAKLRRKLARRGVTAPTEPHSQPKARKQRR